MGDILIQVLAEQELQRVLEPIFDTYQAYACSDGRNFAGNIGCVRKNEDNVIVAVDINDWGEARENAMAGVFLRIEERTDIDKEFEAAAFGATLGAAQGYTVEKIKTAADNIDSARSAVCTTFAVSGANKLLELQKNPEFKDKIKRIEIIARKLGHRGTHCYVIINRKEGSELSKPATWGDETLIVDPWLSSLQNPSVYKPAEYELTGFLGGKLECNFDSTNPNLRKQKRFNTEYKQEIKKGYIENIKNGEIDELLKSLTLYGKKVETLKLGKGFENIFTKAIEYNQNELFKVAWSKIEDPEFIKNRGPLILNKAILANNFELVKFLHENGVELCNHAVEPFAIDRAMDIALATGNDAMFAYIFEQEIATDPSCGFIISTLLKLPQLSAEQGLFINSYLCRLSDEVINELSSWSENTKNVYQWVGSQLDNWEVDAKEKYPAAFAADKDSTLDKPPISPAVSPRLSPLAPVLNTEGIPPPAPTMPSADYFKPMAKSNREVDTSKYRKEKANFIGAIKEHCKTNCQMEISNDVIAHLGKHIDNWERLQSTFNNFSHLKTSLNKQIESDSDKEQILKDLLVLCEYRDKMDTLSESIQALRDNLNELLPTKALGSVSYLKTKNVATLKLLLAGYKAKQEALASGMNELLTKYPYLEGSAKDYIVKCDKLGFEIDNLSRLAEGLSSKDQQSLLIAAQLGEFELVKISALNATKLFERDSSDRTFLDYLTPAQIKELTQYLEQHGSITTLFKIALLQQDLNCINKIRTQYNVDLFNFDSKNDPISNYIAPKVNAESTFSKMSYFFSSHETFNHWLSQALTDEFKKCYSFHQEHFKQLDLELMEINETIMGIRDPDTNIEDYITKANQRCNDITSKLEAFDSEHHSILSLDLGNVKEVSEKEKALKKSLKEIHELLKDIPSNTQERIKFEAEMKGTPKPKV